MRLNRATLDNIRVPELQLPQKNIFELPEKVLQFGTGVLLRGLPDYFIDKANRNGVFNGRIVVVKSTAQNDINAFDVQDNLYTLVMKGIHDGAEVEEQVVVSAISRVLSASDQWLLVLECARNPEMQIIISNATEAGVVLVDDNIHSSPPVSFPGKLLAFLYERFRAFNGQSGSGMVIIPTELLPDNGKVLNNIVVALAEKNGLEKPFFDWLRNENFFCGSLVDRIVPGKLPAAHQSEKEKALGFSDELMTMSEIFRLWAIECPNESVKQKISFHEADEGVVVASNIDKFRELKIRLLNAPHTLSCGIAFLAGFKTVKEAMLSDTLPRYMEALMLNEIVPVLVNEFISREEAVKFAYSVLDRFRNPFIEHAWLSITLNYSSKMQVRSVPLLLKHYERTGEVPVLMAAGFAAFLLFMRGVRAEDGTCQGSIHGNFYPVKDEKAAYFSDKWQRLKETQALVNDVLADKQLWQADLSVLKGFSEAVTSLLESMEKRGVVATLKDIL